MITVEHSFSFQRYLTQEHVIILMCSTTMLQVVRANTDIFTNDLSEDEYWVDDDWLDEFEEDWMNEEWVDEFEKDWVSKIEQLPFHHNIYDKTM